MDPRIDRAPRMYLRIIIHVLLHSCSPDPLIAPPFICEPSSLPRRSSQRCSSLIMRIICKLVIDYNSRGTFFFRRSCCTHAGAGESAKNAAGKMGSTTMGSTSPQQEGKKPDLSERSTSAADAAAMHAKEANRLAEEGHPMKSAAEAAKHMAATMKSTATGLQRSPPRARREYSFQ